MKVFKKPYTLVAPLQTIGLILYIMLVANVFLHGNEWFGQMNFFLGPVAFLMLFCVSALVCGFLVFGFPIYLFFLKDEKREAIKIVLSTTIYSFVFLLVILGTVIFTS